ncbi:MAG: hypothetical protein K9N48_08445, partial [Verrucomicrobia bacterium]|nr:hypothetical protein [Verrucomicrobiota bacterium]
ASDGIPYENIALFGFSQGCVVSVETALTFPKPLAGVIGVSGYIHSSEELIDTLNPKDPSDKEGAQDSNRRPTPAAFIQKLLITHGAHDPLIPIGHARRLFGRLIEKGVNLQWRELHKDHTIVEEVEIPLFREFLKSSFPAERK